LEFLRNHIEALIFCASKPITLVEIQNCLSEMFDAEVSEEDIRQAIEELMAKYEKDEFSFQVYHIAKGYQFLTKPAYKASIGILLKQQSKKRLSTAALETLSIIAYKQPVTKAEIEQIRGVGCDYAVQKLLEKALIDIVGKDDTVGKPLLYGTSDQFMEYFGINSLDDLPTLKDFAQDENTIGVDALDNGEEKPTADADDTETEETPDNERETPSQPDTEIALAAEDENHTETDDESSVNEEDEPALNSENHTEADGGASPNDDSGPALNEDETIQNEEGPVEMNESAPKPEEVLEEESEALPEGDEATSEEKEDDEAEPEQTSSEEEVEVMPGADEEPAENPESSPEEDDDDTEEDATKPGGL